MRGRPCWRWRHAVGGGRKGTTTTLSGTELEEGLSLSEVEEHGWQLVRRVRQHLCQGWGQRGVRGGVTLVYGTCARRGAPVAMVVEEEEEWWELGAVDNGE